MVLSILTKSDVDCLYLARKRISYESYEGCVMDEANNLGRYLKNSLELLVKGVKGADVLVNDYAVNKKIF